MIGQKTLVRERLAENMLSKSVTGLDLVNSGQIGLPRLFLLLFFYYFAPFFLRLRAG
jgi:hypothetical protein